MKILQSFNPIADDKSKILILGSMPGVQSLEEKQYYAHPKNQFWPILFTLFKEPIEYKYENRVRFVLNKRIAIWDVVATCSREGSLDSNIKNVTINDFKKFYLAYPNIKFVAFNGTKAFDLYKKGVGELEIGPREYTQLPSTSPANTLKFEEKLNKWRIILNYL